MHQTFIFTVSPQARVSYLTLASIGRRSFSGSAKQCDGRFHRSDFSGQGWTGIYETGQPTGGPLGGASIVGAPRITPKALKQHLDQYVVGQERAKKALSTAVYNHYQRIQEIQRQDDEQTELEAQAQRRELAHRHPIEDEFPGQQATVKPYPPPPPPPQPAQSSTLLDAPIIDDSPLQIDKSNILVLGPSGVGKTLMAKTLARVLDVPFSMSDCTAFTQAGYIGEDAEVCVQRLLSAANYDVAAAEHGIICLDEIDKIAGVKMAHGKDVSGEGVQQALLKIIEGTTLQIQAKAERGSTPRGPSNAGGSGGFPSNNPIGGPSQGSSGPTPPGGKGEVYNVRTDNILFICSGAFSGLHKTIAARVFKGGMGFGASVQSSTPESGEHETIMKGEEAVFRKHVPYYIPPELPADTSIGGDPFHGVPVSAQQAQAKAQQQSHNILDLVQAEDLQKYGMIPELVGRLGSYCAVHALDEDALVRVLTEPKNSLVKQYEQLFKLSSIELRFTSSSLRAVAKSASGMGTGARGLRTVMERLLSEAMFECPGSGVKHVLVTRDVAELKSPPLYFQRGQSHSFTATLAAEEDLMEQELRDIEGSGHVSSFEEYRRSGAAGG